MSFDAGPSIHLPSQPIGNDTDTEIEKFYFYALEKEIQSSGKIACKKALKCLPLFNKVRPSEPLEKISDPA